MIDVIYALDFETNTKPPGDGLDPTNPATFITSAAVYYGPLLPDSDEPEGIISFVDPIETRLLITLRDFFESPWTKPGAIVTWNGAAFDIPFLISRAERCQVPLFQFDARVTEERKPKYKALKGHLVGYAFQWKKHTHADIWTAFNEIAANAGIKAGLKPVSEYLGLNPIKVDASKMELLTLLENAAYNSSDVHVTFKLAQMMDAFYDEGTINYPVEHYLESNLFWKEWP